MDVVGYSKLLIDDQREVQEKLNQIVRNTDQFREAEKDGKLIRLPSGDGMALVFFGNPEAPVQCALEIGEALKDHPELQLRMGIHTGPVSNLADVNDRSSVAGDGINMAQRVMDCGDAGHILLSKRAADDLSQYRLWHSHLHDLGECEVKHGVVVSVVNLYKGGVGNSQPPQKLKEQTTAFGNFEILRDATGNPLHLGRGTFGRTYQARHRYLETIVALKIISERFARDATVRQRFLTEAKAAAKLSHPHIARLYDFGEKDGVCFLRHGILRRWRSGGLREKARRAHARAIARRGKTTWRRAAMRARRRLGSSRHQTFQRHARGKRKHARNQADRFRFGVHVHGSAAATAEDEAATTDSPMLGTPLFASPEQLREETVDARADLFSLGMTLWYLAIGQSPEAGSLSDITSNRLSEESYSSRLPDQLPTQLKSALQRLLEKDPARRFATAAEFLQELGHETKIEADLSARAEETEVAEPQVEPLALETINAPLASEWKTGSRHNETFTGINYPATSARDAKQQAWLHVLNETLLKSVDLLWRLRLNAARFASLNLPGLLSPIAARGYSDFTAVVLEKPECTPLLNAVPTQATAIMAELQPVLEKIAETCDAIAAVHLPGVNLQASDIWLQSPSSDLSSAQPKLFPRFLSASDAPDLSEAAGTVDASSTITAEMFTSPGSADDMRAQFARLIYRLAAGRNCPAAASLASQAYVAVPNLSEQANRTLALVIARKREYATCRALLQDLRRSEGSGAVTSELRSAIALSRCVAAASSSTTRVHAVRGKTGCDANDDGQTNGAESSADYFSRAGRADESGAAFQTFPFDSCRRVAPGAHRRYRGVSQFNNKPSVPSPPKQTEVQSFSPGTKFSRVTRQRNPATRDLFARGKKT